MDLREIHRKDGNWIYMTQSRVQWQALANRVMNIWVPQKWVIS
jgi:hypothetical protein